MKILTILLIMAALLVLSQEGFSLEDHREYWSVGVAAFHDKNLSPQNLYLVHSFPLLLRERLEAIPSHFFSAAEVQAYRRDIISREQQRLVKALNDNRRARDELFFSQEQRSRSVYDQRITADLDALQVLQAMNLEQIPFPESRPLRFLPASGGELIYDELLLSPPQLAREEDLDLLVWGSFEEIQGFLYFEVNLYAPVLGETLYRYSDAVVAMELYTLVEELIPELASILWGRDWSSLRVETVPEQAAVWIDDRFQGRSPLEIPYLLPGTRLLRVEAPGFSPVEHSLELTPFSEEIHQITLEPRPGDTFSLDSDPSAAAVYDGSRWLGTTPLELEKPEDIRRFLLRREGYLDFPLYADGDVEQVLSTNLIPDDLDPSAIQNRRRDEMYKAFGLFALSLPVPILLWNYGYDFRVLAAVREQDGEDPSQAEYYANLTFGLSLGTMAVSGGLLVNLVLRVIRYLQAADRRA
jgi:hypothetical protein